MSVVRNLGLVLFVLFCVVVNNGFANYFTLPVDSNFTITNNFVDHASYTTAQGTDYAIPIGTNVQAGLGGVAHPHDEGLSNTGGTSGGYGNYLTIDHGTIDGHQWETRYGHLTTGTFLVNDGDTVGQGQILAQSGNSGYSTGPHLHFKVRRDGVPVDPYSITNYLWTTNPPSHGAFNLSYYTFPNHASQGWGNGNNTYTGVVTTDPTEVDTWGVQTDGSNPWVIGPELPLGIVSGDTVVQFSTRVITNCNNNPIGQAELFIKDDNDDWSSGVSVVLDNPPDYNNGDFKDDAYNVYLAKLNEAGSGINIKQLRIDLTEQGYLDIWNFSWIKIMTRAHLWDFKESLLFWDPRNATYAGTEGGWSVKISPYLNDPGMMSQYLYDFNADDYQYLNIRMDARGCAESGRRGGIYFETDSKSFAENGFIEFGEDTDCDSNAQKWYTADLSKNTDWTGMVNRVRIDFFDTGTGDSDIIYIDKIEFSNDAQGVVSDDESGGAVYSPEDLSISRFDGDRDNPFIDIAWTRGDNPIPMELQYLVYRGTSMNNMKLVASTYDTSYHDTDVVVDTWYYYYVIAVCNNIESDPSEEVNIYLAGVDNCENPTASFTMNGENDSIVVFVGDAIAFVGDAIAFVGTSVPGFGEIDHYNWSFGDGSISNEEDATHSYTEEGEYTVRYLVWSSSCGSDEIKKTVTVEADPDDDPIEPDPDLPSVVNCSAINLSDELSGDILRVNKCIAGYQLELKMVRLNDSNKIAVIWRDNGLQTAVIDLDKFDIVHGDSIVAPVREIEVMSMMDGYFAVYQVANYADDGDGAGVFGYFFTQNGIKQGEQIQFNTYITNDQSEISIAGHPDHTNALAVWQSRDQDGSSLGVFASLFNQSTREKIASEFQVNTTVKGTQQLPTVAINPDTGHFFVVWTWRDDAIYIALQEIDQNGNKIGGEVVFDSDETWQEQVKITILSKNCAVITWLRDVRSEGEMSIQYHLYGQIVKLDTKKKIGDAFRINNCGEDYLNGYDINKVPGSDDFVAVFQKSRTSTGLESIYYQKIDSSGDFLDLEKKVLMDRRSSPNNPVVLALNFNQIIVGFDTEYYTGGKEVYLQGIGIDLSAIRSNSGETVEKTTGVRILP